MGAIMKILPIGLSLSDILRDLFVLAVFVVGFTVGAGWQYIERQKGELKNQKAALVSAAKAETVSTNVAGAVQAYNTAAIGAGNEYISTVSYCISDSDDEYRMLGNLVTQANTTIKHSGGVSSNTSSKRQNKKSP